MVEKVTIRTCRVRCISTVTSTCPLPMPVNLNEFPQNNNVPAKAVRRGLEPSTALPSVSCVTKPVHVLPQVPYHMAIALIAVLVGDLDEEVSGRRRHEVRSARN